MTLTEEPAGSVPLVLKRGEDMSLDIVVQKFGGTSVAKEESRKIIAAKAIEVKENGQSAVMVVSAMGRSGDPYATDTLINLVRVMGVEPSSRELDLIMSCGETISAAVMASTIRAMGHDAVALTGFQAGIVTDDVFNNAAVRHVETERILSFLNEGKIVVVTGFQGVTEDGDITTLGRGGSDNTAAILGEALNASSIEIYTDVDGVMTADPRVVPDAKVIDAISYDDVYQLAIEGAKVVDHKAVEVAKRSNRILKIKNTFSDAEGTIICSDIDADCLDSRTLISAVTSKSNIVQFTVGIDAHDVRNESLLNRMEEQNVSIDLINFFEEEKIFTIEKDKTECLESILKEEGIAYTILDDCAKVTVVGHRIHDVPGIMKKIVVALGKADVEILQTSDSSASIACLVKREHAEKAVNILHTTFELA